MKLRILHFQKRHDEYRPTAINYLIFWSLILRHHYILRYLTISLFQERDLGDEYGWKQIHGDVFRPASYPVLLCGFVGSGVHALASALAVILFIIGGNLYTE